MFVREDSTKHLKNLPYLNSLQNLWNIIFAFSRGQPKRDPSQVHHRFIAVENRPRPHHRAREPSPAASPRYSEKVSPPKKIWYKCLSSTIDMN
jgi:hypothetical protein